MEEKLPNCNNYDFLLERNAKYMNNIALTFDNEKITYEELHDKIDEYARALYKKGIRKNDKIAVCVANTPESIYLLYALNKLGAIVVGISPMNNDYKMKRDLELVNPKMFITIDMKYRNAKDACKNLNIYPILYSPVESMSNPFMRGLYSLKQFKDGNFILNRNNYLKNIIKKGKNEEKIILPSYEEDRITDIMFTGGSSGVHKGVELADNGLNCVVKALDDVLILEPGMRHLGNIPVGHMAFGKLVMHYALCKNLEFALTLNALPDKFYDELVRTQAHGAMGGPIHWEHLSYNPNITEGSLTNLIQALSGGEYFKPQKRELANEALKKAGCLTRIGDGLGLTEMWAPVNVCMSGKNTEGTVGTPIPYVKERIVDPNTFKELPNNTPGLLIVNGPGMMKGYYKNEEETNKVFLYDENGEKWYNTGDLAKKLDTNEIKFVGRKKRNFVCGVDNIYPEQIEALLLQLPQIKEACITKIPDEKSQYLPKYHIVLNEQFLNSDTNQIEKAINYLIENTLGNSALPGYIQYDETLPRTDNGKINATLLEANDLEELNNKLKLTL